MKIVIVNGHGLMTAGKRSPDGLFREPFYNREIARKVVADLLDRNLDVELLVPEDDDIPLAERVRRINAHCLALGKKNVIVVSIHVNAAGNGTKWLNATGWSVFTCSGQTESDRLAECLCEHLESLKNILTVTIDVRDIRLWSNPKSTINTTSKMLRELTIDFCRDHFTSAAIVYSHHRVLRIK